MLNGMKICKYETCERPVSHHTKSMCGAHTRRKQLGLDMDAPIREYMKHGQAAERNDRGEKRCTKCHTWKTVDLFHSGPGSVDSLRSECKACTYATNIAYAYKITPERYAEMLSEQDNKCAICRSSGKLVVDHDHACCPGKISCGKCVRKLLCNNCNTRIGWLETRMPEILDYLEK